MKNDRLENRIRLQQNKEKISDDKLQMGDTLNKFPVVMDNGKTIVFISDKSKEAEIRQQYELLKKSRFPMQTDSK